jgi:hypothetical protein
VDVRGRVHNNQPGGVNSFIVFFFGKEVFSRKKKKVTILAAVAC